MDWTAHIVRDTSICRGRATVKGTRIEVATVLDNLAAGVPIDEIISSYPPLTQDHIQACLAYAACCHR